MSDFFQWDPTEFTVHVGAMDREHETLIGIMNRLHERHAAGASRAELTALVRELGNYTVKHFTNEEAHMASVGFPGLRTHQLIHKELLEKFQGHARAFEASGQLTEDFFGFLRRWLKAHIKGIDRQYGTHGANRTARSA